MYGRIMIDVEGTSLSQQDRELISNGNVGGIILFSKNFNSFEQISDLVNEIHAIKENILLVEQKFSYTFKELVLILENFNPSFVNVSGYKNLNGSQILRENITYILNTLKNY